MLCKILFEMTKPWLICGYHGYKIHDFWFSYLNHGQFSKVITATQREY